MTWCGDISYIRTWEGFLYLSFVEDLASRRILGLSMANHMRAELVCDALIEAVGTRGGKVTRVVFHSDRGTQGSTPLSSSPNCAKSMECSSRWAAPACAGTTLPLNRFSPP